jgi:hypothetical protein
VLALEPWAGRLKTVFITPAASDVITQNIAEDYEFSSSRGPPRHGPRRPGGDMALVRQKLEVEGLQKRFGGLTAVRFVSFSIRSDRTARADDIDPRRRAARCWIGPDRRPGVAGWPPHRIA